MVKVRFYGALKQFGATFELDAETPAECIKALTSQIPKLREFIQQGLFTVRIGREYVDNRYLEKGLFYKLKTGMTVHITPVLKGAKKRRNFSSHCWRGVNWCSLYAWAYWIYCLVIKCCVVDWWYWRINVIRWGNSDAYQAARYIKQK